MRGQDIEIDIQFLRFGTRAIQKPYRSTFGPNKTLHRSAKVLRRTKVTTSEMCSVLCPDERYFSLLLPQQKTQSQNAPS